MLWDWLIAKFLSFCIYFIEKIIIERPNILRSFLDIVPIIWATHLKIINIILYILSELPLSILLYEFRFFTLCFNPELFNYFIPDFTS